MLGVYDLSLSKAQGHLEKQVIQMMGVHKLNCFFKRLSVGEFICLLRQSNERLNPQAEAYRR